MEGQGALTLWQQARTPQGRSSLWRKYRRTILIGAGIVGVGAIGVGGYWYWQHWQQWSEEQEMLRIQREVEANRRREEKERAQMQEEAARADAQLQTQFESIQTHFESIQVIADTTTLPSVVPHLKTRLFALSDLTALTQALVASRAEGAPSQRLLTNQQKVQIWEDLKILSFSRALGGMWAMGLLFLFVRIQLNILGRHVYIHTAAEDSGPPQVPKADEQPLSMSCQHKFIAFSDYLPHCGLASMLQDIQAAMKKALQTRSLKDKFNLQQLQTLLRDLHAEFESSYSAKWHQYLLPPQNVLPDDLAVASSAADVAQGGGAGAAGGPGGSSLGGTPRQSSSSDLEDHGAVSTRSGALADAMVGGFQAATRADASEGDGDSPLGAAPGAPRQGSAAGGSGVGGGEGDGGVEKPGSLAGKDDDAALNGLMNETRAVLGSSHFKKALRSAVDAISTVAIHELATSAFGQPPASSSTQPPQPLPSIALAKLLPPVAAIAVPLMELDGNKYLQQLSYVPELTSFSAMVYAGTVGSK